MSQENLQVGKETDLLKYKTNEVPRVIRFVWTILIAFVFYYLAKWCWPDLKEWISKL